MYKVVLVYFDLFSLKQLTISITVKSVIVGFFILISSLKIFGHSIHSERRWIYLGDQYKLSKCTIIISWLFSFRVIQSTVQWHTFKTFMFVFLNSSSSQKLFVKYLISIDLLRLSETRYKPKLSHSLTCVILCSIGYIDVPNNGIEQVCSRASCDTHISPFGINLHFSLEKCLIGTCIVNFMVHKSSYSKCSLAWCQLRTFLLFTNWTHPLQMREYRSDMQVLTKLNNLTIIVTFCSDDALFIDYFF